LTGLAAIFANNLIPIFVVAAAGFAFGRFLQPDIKTVSRLAFYVFTPCLVFASLTQTEVSGGDFWRMAGFTAATLICLGLAAAGAGLALRLDRATLVGLVVVTMFGNGGNYGLPVVLFAFGETALSFAVVFYLTGSIFAYTVGVLIASSGHASPRQALAGVLKVPAIYALLLAGLVNLFGWEVPLPLARPLDLLSRAAVPAMMLVLGLQLAQARVPQRLGLVTGAAVFQLLIGPVVGLLLAPVFGLTGPARQAAVLEAAMPTAVITTILAVEYQIDPAFVTGVVVLTTLLSPLTVTPLIAYLGG
jgi:predicted permease